MVLFLQMDPVKSHGFLFRRFDLRGPPTFKLEMKQQKPQEEEIPVQAMAALKISKKYRTRHHRPYDLPTWGQIKTLNNQAENLISQQGMPLNPENIFSLCLLCLLLLPPFRLTLLITLIGLICLTTHPFYCRL